MRKWTALCAAVLAMAVFAGGACAADEEQALYDGIMKIVNSPVNVAGKTPEEAQKAFLAQSEPLLAKMTDYRKRFPQGPHFTELCVLQANVLFFIATRVPNQTERLDGVLEAADAALARDPRGPLAVGARILRLQYLLAKQSNATAGEDRDRLGAEAVKAAEAIIADFPNSPQVPSLLEALVVMHARAGRDKESAAALERLRRDFPASVPLQRAERTVKQSALKGTAFDLAFKSTTGENIDLKNYRGKVVLVDFWASWCGPCKAAMPLVVAAEKKYRDRGFRVIGVSFDMDRAPMETYIKEQGMPWPQFFDGLNLQSPMAERYFITGIPTTFLIDKSGKVREISLEASKLDEAVARLLDEPAAP